MSPAEIGHEREAVLDEAMRWTRTPYHHGARVRHVGVDCGNFVAACYEAAGVVPRGAVDCRAPVDWYLHSDAEPWLAALAPHLVALPAGVPPQVGDLVLFRFGRAIAAHGGLVVGVGRDGAVGVLHADRGVGVCLDRLTPTSALWPRLAGYHTPWRWTAA